MRAALPVQKDGPRINEEINVREVQLIDHEGNNRGVVPIQDLPKAGAHHAASAVAGHDSGAGGVARLAIHDESTALDSGNAIVDTVLNREHRSQN